MMKTRNYLTTLLVLVSLSAHAQISQSYSLDSVFVLPDSAQPLYLDAFYQLIFENHPVVKQADLMQETAQQEIRLARGAFDPKLQAGWNTKKYKGTEYYNLLHSSLKVPVWFPVDPSISFDQNKGEHVNPEHYISDQTNYQQISAGVSLPIGRGLFIDDRRATLKQAKLFADMADAERVKAINKILLQATKDYWEWYFAYYDYKLLEQSVRIASEIFRRVKLDYEFGEAAVVDTIQASITLQNRKIEMQQVHIAFIQAGLKLSNHLWNESEVPLEMEESVVPIVPDQIAAVLSHDEFAMLQDLAEQNHPELRKLELKLQQLQIEQKLNKENLKPKIDLKYYLINAPISPGGAETQYLWNDNYKMGVDFSFSLFLRKERAKVQKTNIKISTTNLELVMRKREIQNELLSVFSEVNRTGEILKQQNLAVANYERLMEAELFNLENGESDLFKINYQLDKLLEAQSKLLKMRANYQKLKATVYWSAGMPYLGLKEGAVEE